MTGHLEQAAAVLTAAADQVPLDAMREAEQQLDTVVQYVQEAGGGLGERLIQEAFSAQSQIRDVAGVLSTLQQSIQDAAQQVLSHGG